MPDIPSPTQKFVEIRKIKDGVVYLLSGSMRKILMVSGVNFDLKSEAEQNLILNTFQNFLNELDFSVQFFIHSRKVNVDDYLSRMAERKEKEENELLRIQIEEYAAFIRSFVEQNSIISKSFFVVVPYDPISITQKSGGVLKNLFGGVSGADSAKKTEEENMEQLTHRVDEVVSGIGQIGLRAVPLENEELVELFYNLYNPQLVEKRGLEIAKQMKKPQ